MSGARIVLEDIQVATHDALQIGINDHEDRI
jgi:hypothetical protein